MPSGRLAPLPSPFSFSLSVRRNIFTNYRDTKNPGPGFASSAHSPQLILSSAQLFTPANEWGLSLASLACHACVLAWSFIRLMAAATRSAVRLSGLFANSVRARARLVLSRVHFHRPRPSDASSFLPSNRERPRKPKSCLFRREVIDSLAGPRPRVRSLIRHPSF